MSEIHRNTESHNNAVSNNTANNNNTESKKLDSKTQENRKLDSNGDEIVWEMKKENSFATKSLRFWFYASRFLLISFLISLMFYPTNVKQLFVIIFFLFVIFLVAKGIPVSINFKSLYLTNEKLVIKRYLNKDIILPLGSFCVYEQNYYIAGQLILDDKIIFLDFMGNYEYYVFQFECKDYVCDELNNILKPYIINYFLSLKQEDYLKIKNLSGKYAITKISYFKEIDKLREEKRNND
ncbi:hypothetical protein [Helicobacter trogontum]|uniref:Uncharacterized protein n=1 Tax=Helicobacter trogontum TaxID=50960 RepID=A0A4U8T555_9HELI|nr:hypothetical protein [Helicobacter trogontum]MDY5184624.1 hypothetical protein [Helicobacter trogontum]TLD94661.1 hypothetical protein LS80_009890 [Helicobacter trogontum]